MRNFIGNLLICGASIIKFFHDILMFILLVGIVMSIFMLTIIAFFDLIGHVFSFNSEMKMYLLKKPIWDIIILVIGSATMWLGFSKLMENDKREKNIHIKRKIK